MKVGTDSIILGSWAQYQLKERVFNSAPRVIDIGCGSGILAIMMAQVFGGEADILAFEIDQKACDQALDNVYNSPWAKSIHVTQCDVTRISTQATPKSDVIVCNPPYFEGENKQTNAFSLLSVERKTARHQDSLSMEQLLQFIARSLTSDGRAFLVVPSEYASKLKALLNDYSLCCNKQLAIRTTPTKVVTRYCLELTKSQQATTLSELNIYDENNVYTDSFRALCRAFYLKF